MRRNHLKRSSHLIAVVVLALAVVLGPPVSSPAATVSDQTQSSRAKPTYWAVPEPFGLSGRPAAVQASWSRTFVRFRFQVGAGSDYRFRSFRWSSWGRRTVAGRGVAAFCTYRGCDRFTAARIVLKRKVGLRCGDTSTPSSYHYTRYVFTHAGVSRTYLSPGMC